MPSNCYSHTMGHPTWLETCILSILLVASLWGFWRRFGPVFRLIRGSRNEPGFQWNSLAPRAGKFLWEVMLQGKVIRDRPLPGMAHALVFWGFCAFVLVTLNHVFAGYGVVLIPRQSAFGHVYFGFVAIFAAAVAVSIAGLTIRRFIARPVWLGKVAPESGFIALLIFVLMITYLADYAFEPERWNWWIHTLALLIFLPLIPHTKHLHLILSPAAIFAKREGFSQIPPLEGDEDLGLVARKDVSWVDVLQAFSCVECGRCTEQCPAFNTSKELNPKEVILGLRNDLRDGVEELRVPEKSIFQCTTCGGCEEVCPVGIQHLPVIIGMRRGKVNTGNWEDPFGTKMFLGLERSGNSLGFAASERQKFVEKNALPIFDGTQEYCLWLGCMGAYDPGGRETVLSLVRVLNHLGVTFGVLRKEKCTGDPARRLGNDLLFQQMAESGIEQLKAAKKVLSICPHCVRTIGNDWAESGATFQIEHHTELLARFHDKLPSGGDDGQVVYHDPCYLGRYRGVYDAPRELLAKGSALVEASKNREKAFCCGAGGGMMFLGEEEGQRVNSTRARQLADTGAATVAVGCPFCQSMFRDALTQVTDRPVKLLDVVQIVANRLPQNDSAARSG
jgi:Fe-S oxidoreductase